MTSPTTAVAPPTASSLPAPRDVLLDGAWRETQRSFPVLDPGTGAAVAQVADAGPEEAEAAVDAASRAQDAWAATPPRARADVLRTLHAAVLAHGEELAELITLEMGKPLAESRGEVSYGADYLAWFAEEATRVGGEWRLSPDGGSQILTLRQPVGPCLLVTPWNFPLAMLTRKIGPALAAGCTMIVKPAEDTPLTALALAALAMESGVPAGVINLLPTSRPAEVVGRVMNDPRVRKVSFTGSTQVGRLLVRQAAPHVMRTSMELGGNGPFLVFEDADVEAAVDGAMLAKLRNGGQSCVAANRFLVHRTRAEEFTSALTDRFAELKVARGSEEGAQIGPLINASAREKVSDLVDSALAAGATLHVGAETIGQDGFFYAPTVLSDVPAGSALATAEVFGPVAPVTVFDDEDEALRLANDTDMGLASFVYCRDLDRTLRVAEGLRTGMVGVNRGLVSNAAAPFGGINQSGLGKEGGMEGIHEYLDLRYVAIDRGRVNR